MQFCSSGTRADFRVWYDSLLRLFPDGVIPLEAASLYVGVSRSSVIKRIKLVY